MAKVRSGVVVDRRSTLIRPPAPNDHFADFNTWLHHIDADAVRSSPSWDDALESIVEFVGEDVAVFHNAGFNLGVIRQACVAVETDWPKLDFLCTLVGARHAFDLPSYRLSFVAEACGFEHRQRYNSAEDAEAVARVAVALAAQSQVETIEALAERLTIRLGHMDRGTFKSSVSQRANHGLVAPDAPADADPEHPLYGRVVVFTGSLVSMTRDLAWAEVGRVGGIPEYGVTRRTNVLVVGDINPAVLTPGAELTAKAMKAFALRQKGQEIEVMAEDDFLRTL